jgi:hypothetical protein
LFAEALSAAHALRTCFPNNQTKAENRDQKQGEKLFHDIFS